MSAKCYVCNREFDDNVCPRDGFPKILLLTNEEQEALEKLRPDIEACRRKVYSEYKLGVKAYFWKDADGKVVLDKESKLPLGSAWELYDSISWLDTRFARIPDNKTLTVNLCIDSPAGEKTVAVELPNLLEPELQQLGIRMSDDFGYALMLRNASGKTTESKVFSIFD